MSEHNPNNKECSWNGFLHKHDEEGWCPMTYCDCTCATQQEKQDWEDEPWAALLTSFQKQGIRTEIAKAREEARAEVLQKIEDWATTYMDETTRVYGTDKHGIDCDDLLTFINSLK